MASRDMTLKIVACQQVYTGLNPKGHRYTIFDIEAAKADGTLINEKLRSFEALPIGETMLVTVTPFESERHGRSFTLHRKVSNNATGQVNDLRGEVTSLAQSLIEETGKLEQRIEQLEKQVAALMSAKAGQW